MPLTTVKRALRRLAAAGWVEHGDEGWWPRTSSVPTTILEDRADRYEDDRLARDEYLAAGEAERVAEEAAEVRVTTC